MIDTTRTLLRRAWTAIDLTFCKLQRIQFEAPWRPGERQRC
jgi:hypothetical protein